ncbi:hypothetical protein NSU_2752 [Novosphingobium pentaromativorans US6-1]|uniref:Uncharacterized protein n=1 Tax=Novosphingobium pentaromativorans US6-1 TaxID=1088721 RepID=G6EEI0_9SPHN|nr:hypothetical protein NSU_2752 [Novosphingobium pentaromativorans US6-1]
MAVRGVQGCGAPYVSLVTPLTARRWRGKESPCPCPFGA